MRILVLKRVGDRVEDFVATSLGRACTMRWSPVMQYPSCVGSIPVSAASSFGAHSKARFESKVGDRQLMKLADIDPNDFVDWPREAPQEAGAMATVAAVTGDPPEA